MPTKAYSQPVASKSWTVRLAFVGCFTGAIYATLIGSLLFSFKDHHAHGNCQLAGLLGGAMIGVFLSLSFRLFDNRGLLAASGVRAILVCGVAAFCIALILDSFSEWKLGLAVWICMLGGLGLGLAVGIARFVQLRTRLQTETMVLPEACEDSAR